MTPYKVMELVKSIRILHGYTRLIYTPTPKVHNSRPDIGVVD